MKARRIKATIAAMVTVMAVSPEGLPTNAAALDNPSVEYAPAAVIELHYSMPTLLAWASRLSGYPVPEKLPYVAYRPTAFFTDRVCGGNACKAVGWYNDEDVIYLAERYQFADQDDFANSLLLHELVHFLQHHSGRFDSLSCDDSLAREREAYAVQNDFLMNVWSSIRYIAPRPVSCTY